MEHLLDAMITKVYEVKKGESEHGPWQLYNLYFNNGDGKKFGYLQSGKKPIPVAGMGIKHIEFEIEKKGQYTNYNIKKMEVVDSKPESTPTPSATPSSNNKDASFYVSYAKDLQVARMATDPAFFSNAPLDDLAKDVVEVGLMMMQMVNGTTPEKPKNTSTINDQEKEGESPTGEEPWDEKPWSTLTGFIKEVKSFAKRLGADEYDRIITVHKADLLNKLSKEQGFALWQALKAAEKAQEPPDDNIPF